MATTRRAVLLAVATVAVTLAPVPAAATDADPFTGLRVAAEGSRDGYDRALFPHWRDLDGDGCDTRQEVLIDESRRPPAVASTCAVLSGEWLSSYDGVVTADPDALEVDHVVALAEAWDSGASTWDTERRRAFANDLDHPEALTAVTIRANRSKGDSDPAEWQPPARPSWCDFGQAWTATKIAWDLTADQAEIDALQALLDSCSRESHGQ